MKHYIIFGPPGAGKGTQSLLIAEKFKLEHISTGQMLREEIAKRSDIGLMAKEVIERGKFVEDSVVLDMIADKIGNRQPETKGFIFDGFPRTLSQAIAFDQLLNNMGSKGVTAVISLEVQDSVLIERIQKRAQIERREDDSSIETIKNRIRTYHNKTEPLVAYYTQKGKYFSVRGEKEVGEIFSSICKIIEKAVNER